MLDLIIECGYRWKSKYPAKKNENGSRPSCGSITRLVHVQLLSHELLFQFLAGILQKQMAELIRWEFSVDCLHGICNSLELEPVILHGISYILSCSPSILHGICYILACSPSTLYGICYMLACSPSILHSICYLLVLQTFILHGICYMLVFHTSILHAIATRLSGFWLLWLWLLWSCWLREGVSKKTRVFCLLEVGNMFAACWHLNVSCCWLVCQKLEKTEIYSKSMQEMGDHIK